MKAYHFGISTTDGNYYETIILADTLANAQDEALKFLQNQNEVLKEISYYGSATKERPVIIIEHDRE